MKILTIIATQDINKDFFELAYKSADKAGGQVHNNNILVFDFSSSPSQDIRKILYNDDKYISVPQKGFCYNYSFGMAIGIMHKYDFICCLNDDVILPVGFLSYGVKLMVDKPKIGFLGGIQQVNNKSEIPADKLAKMKMPLHIDVSTKFDDLQGRYGDFSAFIVRTQAAQDTGHLDQQFDPTGILADNDWLLRMRKTFRWETWRSHTLPYLHAKGTTQRKLRKGFPKDQVSKQNLSYFMLKWGCSPYSNDEPYEKPFNGMLEEQSKLPLNRIQAPQWKGD